MRIVMHGIPAFLLTLLLAALPASISHAQEAPPAESQAEDQAPPGETEAPGERADTESEQPAELPPAVAPTKPPPTEAPAEPVTEAPPEAAPTIAEIPRRALEAAKVLRSLRDQARPQPSVAEADRKLPDLVEAIEVLRQTTTESDPESLSVRRIETLAGQWQRFRLQLRDYGGSLGERADALEAARGRLQELSSEWEVIRAASEREDLPRELVERIQAVLADTESTATELRDRLDTVLILQNRTSEQQTIVAGQLERLADAHQIARRRILSIDSPPLWRALAPSDEAIYLAGQVEASWRADIQILARFLAEYPQNILAQLIFFLIFAVALFILGRRSRSRLEADEDLATSAHILARPFSAALLLVLLTTRFWYPETPTVVVEINRLLFLIPLIGLLPGLLHERMRPALYGLAWLYLLDGARDLAMEETLLARLLLLGVTVLALAGVIWLLRPGGSFRTYSRNRWWQLAANLMGLAAVLLGISLVGNIFGNTTLANLLTYGTLGSAYGAVVLAAGSLVLRGLTAALLHTEWMRSFPSVRQYGDLILARLVTGYHLLALYFWGWLTLVLFDIWGPVTAWISGFLGTEWTLGGLSLSLADILIFALAIGLAVLASRFVRFVLQEDVFPRIHLPRGVAGSMSILVNYAILALGFFVALTVAGIEWSRFALIAGALGVGIGFGLQNIVNNFVSGLVLIFERPIQLGDTIEVGPLLGIVRRIGIRSSTVRTYDGAEVIVPNGDLISKEVVNWTLSDQNRRIEIAVGVKYGTDPRQVLEILEEVARGHDRVLEFPSPRAFFEGFGDSSLNFLLRFWTGKFQDWWNIKSEVTVGINDAIKAAGIEIPFPQRDLHLRSVDGDAGRALSGREPVNGPGDE
jgi:small-conductance mechanosensitive channel